MTDAGDRWRLEVRPRAQRQRRVLMRDSPPLVWFVVDEFALYRLVGSAEIMTVQMRQLSAVAAMPNVTLQVLPAIAHPATASGFVLADNSAYAEHVTSGYVITDETVSAVANFTRKMVYLICPPLVFHWHKVSMQSGTS